MVKFKIGFVVDAETLFGILSKFLPVDDLVVEELSSSPQSSPPSSMPHLADRTLRVATMRQPRLKRASPPVRKSKRKPSKPMNLNAGVNRIILDALFSRPHRASEFRPLLKAAGFSGNSAGSRLQQLERHGIVKRVEHGLWTTSAATVATAEIGTALASALSEQLTP